MFRRSKANGFKNNNKARLISAQVIIEFTFSMIIIFLMIYGLMMIFRWTGMDLAFRRISHEDVLTNTIERAYTDPGDGPLKQLSPYFHTPTKMNAVWDEGF